MKTINRQAILHLPLSQYAFANNEESITIRLRAAKNNLKGCVLYFGDRAYMSNPVPFEPRKMELAARDLYFDYFEYTLEPVFPRVCYCFELISEEEKVFLCADLFLEEMPTERSEFYQYPFIRREQICKIPEWFKTAVVYNIFPDSFAGGKEFLSGEGKCLANAFNSSSKSKLGGTINGIRDNLDYIQGMGFNCLYLNPVFTAGEYHKYDLTDYYSIDPCFGSNEDFKALVDEIHSRNMYIIIDGVFNHCGWNFFPFRDVVEKGASSKYASWFYRLELPVKIPENAGEKPNYSCFAYEKKMPKLNTSNPEVKAYFMDVCKYWLTEYDVDGWRLDVANEVDFDFWQEFRKTAKKAKAGCVLIAEIWENAEVWLRGDMFDSSMNYGFRRDCRDFFASAKIDAAEFGARLAMFAMAYPSEVLAGQLNLLDSHDVSRFLQLCGGNVRRLKLAVIFQMLFPGVPSVFYGDELEISGLSEDEYRRAMPWDKTGGALVGFYRQAIGLRGRGEDALGNFRVIQAKENEMLFIFEKRSKNSCVRAALNPGEAAAALPCDFDEKMPYWHEGWAKGRLEPFSFAVWRE